MDVKNILAKAVENGASDIFVIAGLPLTFEINGHQNREGERLTPEMTAEFASAVYEIAKREKIGLNSLNKDDDFSFSLSGIGRFRVNVFHQRGSIAAVVRVIRFELPTAESKKNP